MGGGILGMTMALRLAQKGFKVTIIEGSDRTGGLASPCKIGNYTWDQFYHVIVPSDSNLLGLLNEIGVEERIRWRQTKTGFFTDGNLYSMSNALEFLAFPHLNLLDKIRLGFTIFYASKIRSWRRLEGIPVTNWLRRLSGERTFYKIWLPLLKSKLGENYRITSAAFIWTIISRMYRARETGMKKETFGYVDGGYATILDNFQHRLDEVGVETICKKPVSKILNNKESAQLETLNGDYLKFDKIIMTIPCSYLPNLCPQLSPSEKERFQNVIYEGVLCASLILKRPMAGYYITNITDEWIPFTGVIEMTALVDKKYFDGNSLIYLPRYLIQEDSFWEKSDEEIKEEFVMTLESMYSTFKREDVLFFKIVRAKYVLPITTLHYSSALLPPTGTSLEHLFVVNSAQIANGTMNVNEIVGLANRKAEEISNLLLRSK
ncbi:MAG: NAD(P)/FAD-dependent oxidoreductase [Nitrospirota bacterium]